MTENGFVRIVSHVSYPNLRLTPFAAAESLGRFKAAFPGIYHFWTDSLSLTDTTLFQLAVLTGSRQTTDAYLAAIAFHHGGRLATIDASIPWRSVRGATANTVDPILS